MTRICFAEDLDERAAHRLGVDAGCSQRVDLGDLDAVHPVHHEQAPRGVLPNDLGDQDVLAVCQFLGDAFRVVRLVHEVQLGGNGLGEFVEEGRQVEVGFEPVDRAE